MATLLLLRVCGTAVRPSVSWSDLAEYSFAPNLPASLFPPSIVPLPVPAAPPLPPSACRADALTGRGGHWAKDPFSVPTYSAKTCSYYQPKFTCRPARSEEINQWVWKPPPPPPSSRRGGLRRSYPLSRGRSGRSSRSSGSGSGSNSDSKRGSSRSSSGSSSNSGSGSDSGSGSGISVDDGTSDDRGKTCDWVDFAHDTSEETTREFKRCTANQTITFVGDSNSRENFVAMLCRFHAHLPPYKEGSGGGTFQDHNHMAGIEGNPRFRNNGFTFFNGLRLHYTAFYFYPSFDFTASNDALLAQPLNVILPPHSDVLVFNVGIHLRNYCQWFQPCVVEQFDKIKLYIRRIRAAGFARRIIWRVTYPTRAPDSPRARVRTTTASGKVLPATSLPSPSSVASSMERSHSSGGGMTRPVSAAIMVGDDTRGDVDAGGNAGGGGTRRGDKRSKRSSTGGGGGELGAAEDVGGGTRRGEEGVPPPPPKLEANTANSANDAANTPASSSRNSANGTTATIKEGLVIASQAPLPSPPTAASIDGDELMAYWQAWVGLDPDNLDPEGVDSLYDAEVRAMRSEEMQQLGVEVLDTAEMMALRSDAHTEEDRDRNSPVHTCLPGPVDDVNSIILNMICSGRGGRGG